MNYLDALRACANPDRLDHGIAGCCAKTDQQTAGFGSELDRVRSHCIPFRDCRRCGRKRQNGAAADEREQQSGDSWHKCSTSWVIDGIELELVDDSAAKA